MFKVINAYAAGAIGKDRLQETCSFHLGNYHTVYFEEQSWLQQKTQVAANIASVEAS